MKTTEETLSGWNAVGHPVPASRLTACQETLSQILPDVDNSTAHSIVAKIAECVKRNELHRVTADVCDLDPDLAKVDVTGRYRLLAVILTAEIKELEDKIMSQEEPRYKLDPSNMKIYTKDQYVQDCLGGLPNVDMLEEQWEKLPDVTVGYDSEADTLKHIKRVNELLIDASKELLRRAQVHDDSKLKDPEKAGFDKMTPILKNLKYGSPEYKASLAELKVSLDHHYANNSHHPEHYENGLDGFDLFDLVEMFFDWKAATERTNNGNIFKSIEYNTERFNIPTTLANIMENTAERLGYERPEKDDIGS